MAALDLNILSLALFGATAVAFTRQRRIVMVTCGALFAAVTGAASVLVWLSVSPHVAILLLAIGMALPLAGLALYAIDRVWACFSAEMTYASLLCWVLWPLLILINFLGLLAC